MLRAGSPPSERQAQENEDHTTRKASDVSPTSADLQPSRQRAQHLKPAEFQNKSWPGLEEVAGQLPQWVGRKNGGTAPVQRLRVSGASCGSTKEVTALTLILLPLPAVWASWDLLTHSGSPAAVTARP